MQLCVFLFGMQHSHLMTGPASSDDGSSDGYRGGQLALQDVADLLGAHRQGKLDWGICERDNGSEFR